MTSAHELKEWATDYVKQAKVGVSTTTANGYRRLTEKLHELTAGRPARDAQRPPPRNDPSPSPDE
jgi:hypothetical protein